MTIPSQALRYLQLETSLGKDAVILTQASGHERLGQLFELTLQFTCQTGSLNLDDLLGTAATLAIHNAAENRKSSVAHTRYFNGYFSSIAFGGYGAEGQASFQATLVPWLWFLTRTADCRIFQHQTVPEILEEVFRDAGFADFKKDLRANYQPREFCVQYRETDFNFVSRLMELEGIYYFFEHENGSHKLVLCDDMACHKHDPLHATLKFIGGAEARDRKGTITDWNFSRQIKPGKFAHNDFNFTTPTPDPNLRLLARSSAPKPQKPGPYEIYDNHGGYGTIGEGNRYARLRMEEIIADRDIATARTDIIGIKAGCKFMLDKHPIANQNREHLITAVQWSAAEGGYGSGSAGSGSAGSSSEGSGGGSGDGEDFFECNFTCIPADATFRPVRSTPLPKIDGPQTATVCGPADQEIYVDEHARVKVQFHWDRYGKSDASSSCWIRVSQPWAGGSFGGMAIPRIGHEVIVEFIEADPDRPIITGRVYNGKNMPHASNAGRDGKPGNAKPTGVPQAAMMTSFKSNSLGGSGGHNEITMNDTGGSEGLFFKAQKDEIHTVGNDREDTVGNNETVKIGNNRDKTVGSNETVKIGANATESVGAAKSLAIGADYQVSVRGAMNESVGGTKMVTIGGDLEVTTGGNHSDTATEIRLTARTKITLACGASTLIIEPAMITIKSPLVKVNC